MLRGLVVVIMAIDHVRDYFYFGGDPDPASNPNITAGLFATRWITHFCAPVFVFLAGVSAGLMRTRKSRPDLSRFLLSRGLWLVFVELVLISTILSFSPGGIKEAGGLIFLPLGVIWAIGASMTALAGLMWLGRRGCLVLGVAIVAGHNLLDRFWPTGSLTATNLPLWAGLHTQLSVPFGPFLFVIVYPVLAWIGVMALGFGLSKIFELDRPKRDSTLIGLGCAVTAAFVLIRASGVYGDPNPWEVHPGNPVATIIDFLNTTKYPPSLDYLMMTLGPSALVCAFAERIPGVIRNTLVLFGRVPFAFYVTHFFLIHVFSIFFGVTQGFEMRQFMTIFLFYPKGYGIGLAGVYAIWAALIAVLYPFCRWVGAIKAKRKDWWLSYV